MKKLFIQSLLCLSPILFQAQENTKSSVVKRNTIYFEAFGQGLYNSFSYDRLYLKADKKYMNSFAAGITIIPHPELLVLGIPVSYNYLFGKNKHHFELGIGLTAMYLREGRISATESYTDINGVNVSNHFMAHQNNFYSYFTPKIGYRFQKPAGGLFFRICFTPAIAGINVIGGTRGGSSTNMPNQIQYFNAAAFFEPYKIIPWAGFGIGYTLK